MKRVVRNCLSFSSFLIHKRLLNLAETIEWVCWFSTFAHHYRMEFPRNEIAYLDNSASRTVVFFSVHRPNVWPNSVPLPHCLLKFCLLILLFEVFTSQSKTLQERNSFVDYERVVAPNWVEIQNRIVRNISEQKYSFFFSYFSVFPVPIIFGTEYREERIERGEKQRSRCGARREKVKKLFFFEYSA